MTASAIIVPGESALTLDTSTRNLTADDARALTAEIQRTSVRLWVLVTEAYDRHAHAALDYPTWDDYVRGELKMSPSRSYQLLDTGHVMKELAKGGQDLETAHIPPVRVVARVKSRLPEVRRSVQKAIRQGGDAEMVDQAIRTLARQPVPARANVPEPEAPPPRRAGRPPALVICPLCVGEGKVSRSLSTRVQAWLKKRG